MNGAQAIIETFLKNKTDITFGYPGGSVIPLFDEYLKYEGKIKNVLVRHEQGAAHAANAYARVARKPGVCIATSGPGATNLVTGIMDSYMDSIPIIAFGGQVPVSLIGNDAFQESDMMGITIPITKHNFQIRTADEAAPIVMKSYQLATSGRPGPIYIDLPKNIQTDQVKKTIPKEIKIPTYQPTLKPNPKQIKRAAELILNAERPIFLIGGGVIAANASSELKQLIDMTKIPITTTSMGKGVMDERHPLSLGVVGMHGRKVANYAIVQSDLIISIGCRFSDRITGNLKTYAENAKVIHVDIDPAEIGKNVKVDIPLVADAKNAIIELINAIKLVNKTQKTEWGKKMRELADICSKCVKEPEGKGIYPPTILKALNKILKEDDIVCTGVGQHQMFAMHYLTRMKPGTYITSGGAGTMGFGLPAAIGAKIAAPDTRVLDIDGDGSFQMTIQELGTIAQEQINVTPIIFNNSYLGMVRQWLELFFGKRYSQVSLHKGTPDFVKVAEAYGLKGIRIEKESELEEGLKKAITAKESTVVDIKVQEESNILPMLKPGGDLKEAFGNCIKAPGMFFD